MRAFYTSSTCNSNEAGQYLAGGLAPRDDDSGTTDFDYDDLDSEDDGGNEERVLRVRQHRDSQARKVEKQQGKQQKRGYESGGGCLGATPLGDIALDIPATQASFWDSGTSSYFFDATSIKSSSSTRSKIPSTVMVTTTVTTRPVTTRTCDGDKYQQACYHYSSVAQQSTYSRASCLNQDKSNNLRPLTKSWNDGHKSYAEWTKYTAQSYVNPQGKTKCKTHVTDTH